MTLGSSTLCDIYKLQGGRSFRSRGNPLQYMVESRDGVVSTLRYLEGGFAPWLQALSNGMLGMLDIHNRVFEGVASFQDCQMLCRDEGGQGSFDLIKSRFLLS